MKIGKLIYITMIISMLFLYACGGGGGGGGTDDPGDNPTPTPDDPIIEAGALTASQAQDALYAVYAGIGYNKNSALSYLGNDILYDVMVENFNYVIGSIALDAINYSEDSTTNLIKFITIGKATFNFDLFSDNYTATMYMEKTEIGKFRATLNIALKKNGYQMGDVYFFGPGTTNDISAVLEGEYYIDFDLLKQELKDFNLTPKKVTISAGKGLKQLYVNPKATIEFDKWNLAYEISYNSSRPTNYSLIPAGFAGWLPKDKVFATYPDVRDYTLSGSFTINSDKKFSYNSGFNYKQEQGSCSIGGTAKPVTMMSANGQLTVPGLNGYIKVVSTLKTEDPITNKTVINHVFENGDWSNNWQSGKLVFQGKDAETSVVFENNSAAFTSGVENWKVDDWKTTLNIIK
jgi:hypothetical protein